MNVYKNPTCFSRWSVRWQEDISTVNEKFIEICKNVADYIKTPIYIIEKEYIRNSKIQQRNLEVELSKDLAKIKMNEILKNKKVNEPYIYLESGAIPWKSAVMEYNKNKNDEEKIYFEIHEDKAREQISLICTPPDKNHLFDKLIEIPEEINKNKYCVFRHSTGFMASFSNLNAAKKVANDLYKINILDKNKISEIKKEEVHVEL